MKWYYFWMEILLGIAILVYTEASIFILFVYVVIRFTVVYESLRKLIRVYQCSNDAKLLSITKKLKISEEEIDEVWLNTLDELTSEQKQALEKDFRDISKY